MNRKLTLSFSGLLGAATLGGCLGDSDRSSGRDRDRDLRGSVERDAGTVRHVPREARLVDEGRGSTLGYIFREDGTVYLQDASAGVVVWDGRVRDGDRVLVTPARNRIEINGKEVASIDLKKNDRFELYFARR